MEFGFPVENYGNLHKTRIFFAVPPGSSRSRTESYLQKIARLQRSDNRAFPALTVPMSFHLPVADPNPSTRSDLNGEIEP